jgi:hypothetical protein
MYYSKSVATSPLLKKHISTNSALLAKSSRVSRFSIDQKTNTLLYNTLGTNVQTTDFVLNFKRLRFFPLARPRYSGETIFTTSLGNVAKFLNKGKSFTKKKAVFLLVATLLRRVLLYSGLIDMHLVINRMPQYFQEIVTHIHSPSKSLYNHPFLPKKTIDESSDNIQVFDFKYVSFVNTKSYGYVK